MARNDNKDKKSPAEKRVFKKIDERVRVEPLWRQEKPNLQRQDTPSSSEGFSTTRISEDGYGSVRVKSESGSDTSRTLETSSESESIPDFSKVKFAEKWEENILALEKGEIPGDELKARGSHNRKIKHVNEIFGHEKQAVQNEMTKYTELMQNQRQMTKIENDPAALRKFISSATTWAAKAKTLEVPGADKFSNTIQQFQKDHLNSVKENIQKQKLTSADRRQKFAENRQKGADLEQEKPRPGKK